MDVNKILSADILDILFENRNKEYGAYDLRKTYEKRIRLALFLTVGLVAAAFAASFLVSSINDANQSKLEVKDVVLQEYKQEEKKPEIPPPPPPKQEPPKVEMTKFTPPKIVKDEEVKKEDIPPEITKLEDTKIAVVSQEGIKDLGIATPAVVDQGKQVIEVKKDDENKVFEKVEVEAEFPGGEGAWRKYLERNLNPNAPVDAGAPEGQYTVWIQFIVDKEGVISDVKPLTKHGYGMENEAMKVINKGPKWKPALQNGRNVKAYRKQPITFVVSSDY
jgi:periplasmic protein TonB